MKTYVYEYLVVAPILATTALLSGGAMVDWIAAAAVFMGFAHASIADRLAEREMRRRVREVACAYKAQYFWVAKEILWIFAFVLMRSWPALVGCAVFVLYPLWRRVYRAHVKPLPPLRPSDLRPLFSGSADWVRRAQGHVSNMRIVSIGPLVPSFRVFCSKCSLEHRNPDGPLEKYRCQRQKCRGRLHIVIDRLDRKIERKLTLIPGGKDNTK